MANNVQRSAPPRPASPAKPASSSPAQNRAASKPAQAPNASPAKSNPSAPTQDKFKPSAEMRENQNKDVKPGGCTKPENGNSKPESKPQDPGQQVANDPAWDKLEGKVSDIQRQLEELRQGQKPGCQGASECEGASQGKRGGGGASQGKRGGGGAKPAEESSAAEKAKEDDKKDPDSELQKLAVAALTAVAMAQAGQNQQQQGQQGGQGNPAEIKNQLRSKCDQLKGQGFSPKGETRAVVSAALGADPFGAKGTGAPAGAPPASGNPPTTISPPVGAAPDFLSGMRRTA